MSVLHKHADLPLLLYLLSIGLKRGQVSGPGLDTRPWTTLLSSPAALEGLPDPTMGLWTGTKSLPPQMLLSA